MNFNQEKELVQSYFGKNSNKWSQNMSFSYNLAKNFNEKTHKVLNGK